MSEPLVTGEILFPDRPVFSESTVAYVQLLDISLADAPSTIVAEQVIRDIAGKLARGEAIVFAVYGEIQNLRARYSVSVHVDVDGDDRVSLGDYITTQSYPVITFGYPKYVTVKAALVT